MLHHFWPMTVYLGRLLRHKYWVFCECARYGLYWQGLIHDYDKWWPPTLLDFYVNYYCRHFKKDLKKHPGYQRWVRAKNRHYLRHGHHAQHWIRHEDGQKHALEMPEKFAMEMVCEWLAINRSVPATIAWYRQNHTMLLHPTTRTLVEGLLQQLASQKQVETNDTFTTTSE